MDYKTIIDDADTKYSYTMLFYKHCHRAKHHTKKYVHVEAMAPVSCRSANHNGKIKKSYTVQKNGILS